MCCAGRIVGVISEHHHRDGLNRLAATPFRTACRQLAHNRWQDLADLMGLPRNPTGLVPRLRDPHLRCLAEIKTTYGRIFRALWLTSCFAGCFFSPGPLCDFAGSFRFGARPAPAAVVEIGGYPSVAGVVRGQSHLRGADGPGFHGVRFPAVLAPACQIRVRGVPAVPYHGSAAAFGRGSRSAVVGHQDRSNSERSCWVWSATGRVSSGSMSRDRVR